MYVKGRVSGSSSGVGSDSFGPKLTRLSADSALAKLFRFHSDMIERHMDLYCDQCNEKLTRVPLAHVDFKLLRPIDEQPLLADGQFLLAEEFDCSDFGVPITHIVSTTALCLVNHTDENRFVGCCGFGKTDKYNQVCWKCKYEIGIIYTDCIAPQFTAINLDRLSQKPKW